MGYSPASNIFQVSLSCLSFCWRFAPKLLLIYFSGYDKTVNNDS